MKSRIIMVLLSATLVLLPCGAALADSDSTTTTHQPEWMGFTLSPINWEPGEPEEQGVYESGVEGFALVNTGGGVTLGSKVLLDVYVQGTNATTDEELWLLSDDGGISEELYGLLFTTDGGSYYEAISGAESTPLAEGLYVGYSKKFGLKMLPPTIEVNPGDPVSTSIFVYAVRGSNTTDLCGEKDYPVPEVEFGQYPSEVKVEGMDVGNSEEFTLYIRNRTEENKTYHLSIHTPTDDNCQQGHTGIPDPNWVTFYHEGNEVETIEVAGNNQRATVQVKLDIPRDAQWSGENWECWVGVTPEQEEVGGVNIVPILCSRLLVSTSDEASSDGGLNVGMITGIVCGSIFLLGLLGWSCYKPKENDHASD